MKGMRICLPARTFVELSDINYPSEGMLNIFIIRGGFDMTEERCQQEEENLEILEEVEVEELAIDGICGVY